MLRLFQQTESVTYELADPTDLSFYVLGHVQDELHVGYVQVWPLERWDGDETRPACKQRRIVQLECERPPS
ncbi:MAG: hypothetical protein OXL34_12490 [Gemmatimonadota bacterium]|nr:hypothetical protein [Gemmatimonadota bacterium]